MASYEWSFFVIFALFSVYTEAYTSLGHSCLHREQHGVCTKYDDEHCKMATEQRKLGVSQMTCRGELDNSEVCCVQNEPKCPPLTKDEAVVKKNGRKAHDKCIDWHELQHPCVSVAGKPDLKERSDFCNRTEKPLKVGLGKAHIRDFPHLVLLGYERNKNDSWECNGVLISELWVLTSAHCIKSLEKNVSKVRVRVDDVNKFEGLHNIYSTREIILHPEYVVDQMHNDIALLKLEEPVTFSSLLMPACLHVGDEVDDGMAMVAGWGVMDIGKRKSENGPIIKATLEKYKFEDCSRKYKEQKDSKELKEDTQMCFGMKDEKIDMCLGDNGAAIQIYNKNVKCMYTIIGLVSQEKVCGASGLPAIITKVAPYVPWIESIVWPDTKKE